MSSTWGHDSHPLLTVEQAWADLARDIAPLAPVEVPLGAAHNLVLAAPIRSESDHPPFDKAMMDGFAVRSADCTSPNATLRMTGLIAAGPTGHIAVNPGEAVRINTGAAVPAGADAVVMIERTVIDDAANTVCINTAVTAGQNIEPRASILRAQATVLPAGTRLGPPQIAAAATCGAATLTVYPKPTVAILTTGDELVPAGTPRKPGQIHESNGPMLAALMRQFGAAPSPPQIVPDNMPALTAALRVALQQPVVIAAGGMSMGTHDLVPKAFESLGVRWRWHGVSMRPGKPVAHGRGPTGQHVFGLPGNPVSAFVCSWLFVRMVIDGLQGLPPAPPPRRRATLAVDLKPHRDPRPAFIPALAWEDPQRGTLVRPTDWKGSSDPVGLATANALLLRPTPATPAASGTPVEIIPITPC